MATQARTLKNIYTSQPGLSSSTSNDGRATHHEPQLSLDNSIASIDSQSGPSLDEPLRVEERVLASSSNHDRIYVIQMSVLVCVVVIGTLITAISVVASFLSGSYCNS